MNTINFNLDAMKAPKNKAEYILLLDEAIRTADELNEQLDKIGTILKDKHCNSLPA